MNPRTNVHEHGARNRKAARLAAAWAKHCAGYDADAAADLDQQGRDALAALAGQSKPSEATWAETVKRIKQAARRR